MSYQWIIIVFINLLTVNHILAWSSCDICECSKNLIDCTRRNFTEFKNLELPEYFVTLDFSDNMVSDMDHSTFTSIPHSLENIFASGNKFEFITADTFSSFLDLRVINLSNNLITFIAEDAFANHTTLYELILSFNQIEELHPRTFSSLNDLKVLDLSFNQIKTIGEFTLQNLVNLKTLDLSFLQLQTLHPASFDWNLTIEKLDISHNFLINVPTRALWCLRRSLADLEFSGNFIEVIPTGAFMGQRNLKNIKIEQWLHLKRVDDYAFQDLESLEKLILRYLPKIYKIESKAFHLNPDLVNGSVPKCPIRDFALEFTTLTVISEDLLDWTNLRYLSFRNNRWICDCNLVWMLDTKVEMSSRTMFCSGPPQNDGKKLFKVPKAEFTCNFQIRSKSGIGVVVLIFAIGLLISFVTVGILVYRHNGWLVRRPPRINYDRVHSTSANTITIYEQTDCLELENQSVIKEMTAAEGT